MKKQVLKYFSKHFSSNFKDLILPKISTIPCFEEFKQPKLRHGLVHVIMYENKISFIEKVVKRIAFV